MTRLQIITTFNIKPSFSRRSDEQSISLLSFPNWLLMEVVKLIHPTDRRFLRIANEKMKAIVDMNMHDLYKIAIWQTTMSTCDVEMKSRHFPTANKFEIVPPSLPFLLHWAGIHLTTLSVTTAGCFSRDGSRLVVVQEVFRALNDENLLQIWKSSASSRASSSLTMS
uniref:F-box domain-containing protein n=1 Tax=Plectus sambesii TaxID=2011161 RepID=A0A914VGJ3_9BILA